ncbi:uncharacterized protein LOC107040136 [Diachasma alloeum]|uniref:uncharacterized protein LOC107040136 n=1 Tax=Diachasma alloeum TaxID=454923 RepID=UPI0007381F2A|nr:uncharacterized protein LOC107040136 [Diachasma alloeum]
MGDLNARIGQLQAGDDVENFQRKSRDREVLRGGRRLIEFCDLEGLVVANGAIKGDWEGTVTYVGKREDVEGSVIDLVMYEGRADVLEEMRVWPTLDSDHMGIGFTLHGPGGSREKVTGGVEGKKGASGGHPPVNGKEFKLAWKSQLKDTYHNLLEGKQVAQGDGEDTEARWERLKETIAEVAFDVGMVKRLGGGHKTDENAWLGDEVKFQRAEVFKCLKKYLRADEKGVKTMYKTERAKLRKMTKERMQEIKEERENRVRASRGMGGFWDAINGCRPRTERKGKGIPGEAWVVHMGNILGGTDLTRDEDREWEKMEEWMEVEALDRDISYAEFCGALKALKNGKAAGEDEIAGEFLKYLPENWKVELWKVTQKGWETGSLMKGWEVARIFPIHKGGDENDVGNYRGISLLNLGYKLLASIMADRLGCWLEKEGKLNESQGGFRRRRGTREQIFILNSLIGNSFKRKGGKLYAAFIDLKAAFDTVDRDLLLEKIWRVGIRARFYDMIKAIYRVSENEVITGEGITGRFSTVRGVRQGCPLSPILFNLFVDDIDDKWEGKGEGGTVLGGEKVFCLKYADDIVAVADDKAGLQSMLNTAEKYFRSNRLEINVNKTKIMVFNRGGRKKKGEKWEIYGREVEVVSRFKYLGFWFSAKNAYGEHIRKMAGKGVRAVNAAWGVATRAGLRSLKSRLYVLNTLGKSGALYGTEIWGLSKRPEMESVHGRVVKMGMGVTRNTPDYLWRAESGTKSLIFETRRRALHFLGGVSKLEKDRMVRVALKEELRALGNSNPTAWGKEVRDALRDWGGEEFLGILGEGTLESKDFREKVGDYLERGEEKVRSKDSRKIRESKFNPDYKFLRAVGEDFCYWEEKGVTWGDKVMWARLRCGNLGRAGNKGYKDMSCRLCGAAREDLEHILSCDMIKGGVLKEIWDDWRVLGRGETIIELLGGEPIPELCKFFREWEKLMRGMEEG